VPPAQKKYCGMLSERFCKELIELKTLENKLEKRVKSTVLLADEYESFREKPARDHPDQISSSEK